MSLQPFGSSLRALAACAVSLLLLCTEAFAQAALPTPVPQARVPYVAVLVWHDVLPEKEVWFDTTTATFAQQLDAVRKGGFHVISLQALRDHFVAGAPIPAKPLVFTFDDNGEGIYHNAFPLLKKYHLPATLFVHSNYVGKTTSKHHNSWDELREMQRSGLIEIQSLTANHPPDLTKLSDADVVHELRLSAYSIEHRLGKNVYALVYPYDVYDDRVERLAASNGYTLAFTEDWGDAAASSSLLEIHRYSILTRFDQALADVSAHAR
jgi:peptidoglycan/xylan/chitin deacetylase (PgdA/CDA1 family)